MPTKYGTIKVEKLSVSEIDIPPNNSGDEVGTLKLSANLEVGGDGLILHDLEEFVSADNGETITYADDETAQASVNAEEGESTNTLTSSRSKTIKTAEDITLNGKTFSITQSGTIVTIATVKKIISLEAANLVIADYNASTGARTNKEIIMDTNNSISEIAGGEFDLKVKTLDVTNTTSINESAPSPDGSARIDNNLTVGGATTLSGALNATTGAFTTLSTSNLLSANAGLTVANGTTLTSNTVDINGGAIDGTVIGATSAVAGTFTTLTVNDELVIAAGATITGDTEGQITLNVEGAPGQTQDIFTVRQNGAVVNKLEVDKDGVTTAASLVATTADINAGTIDNTIIGANNAVAGTFTNLTSNTSLISSKSFVITPNVITSASIDENNPTDLDESVSVFYFDLNNTSAMYGIFAAGTTGQMINIFYDNNEAAGSLKIDFGATKLRTGSGESRYLTFTITGQSASLMYISTVDKWCVTNTGAAVS